VISSSVQLTTQNKHKDDIHILGSLGTRGILPELPKLISGNQDCYPSLDLVPRFQIIHVRVMGIGYFAQA